MTAIFLDTADLRTIRQTPSVDGFTTNPSLMRRAGVTGYEEFALTLISVAAGRPVSLEVIADDREEIVRQARLIGSWGSNVWVKIPVVSTRGEPLLDAIHEASRDVRVNVTAVASARQTREIADALTGGLPSLVSVIAGRVADNGDDPELVVRQCVRIVEAINEHTRILWASVRQAYDVERARRSGAHAITLPPELLARYRAARKPTGDVSRDTVREFWRDAVAARYRL